MMPRMRAMLYPTIALLSLSGCAKQTDFAGAPPRRVRASYCADRLR